MTKNTNPSPFALAMRMALAVPRRNKRKPTLDELAQLIRRTHAATGGFADRARLAASVAIQSAVRCALPAYEALTVRFSSAALTWSGS